MIKQIESDIFSVGCVIFSWSDLGNYTSITGCLKSISYSQTNYTITSNIVIFLCDLA